MIIYYANGVGNQPMERLEACNSVIGASVLVVLASYQPEKTSQEESLVLLVLCRSVPGL